MKRLKKCLAAVMALAIMATATACGGTDKTWAIKNDSLTVPIGAYIYNLYSAYQQADSQKEDGSKPVLEQQIEGQDAATWIKDNALRQTKSILVIDDKMKEFELSLTEDEVKQVNNQTANNWSYIGTEMDTYGVAQSSFNLAYSDYYAKYSKVFDAIYNKGGTQEVPEADIKDYFVKNYTAFSYVLASQYDMTTGEAMSDEDVEKVDKDFKEYADKINAGEMTIQEAATAYQTSSGQETEQLNSGVEDFVKNPSSYPEEFSAALNSMKNGEARMVDAAGMYKILLVKEDVTAKVQEQLDNDTNRQNILIAMKSDEFKDTVNKWADEYQGATINEGAIKDYNPTMFVPKESSSAPVSSEEEAPSDEGGAESSSSEAA